MAKASLERQSLTSSMLMKTFLLLCLMAVCYGGRIEIPENGIRFSDSRIVGGSNADITEFPHQISMTLNGKFLCGGSIVADNIVLTAGHCTYMNDPASIKIFSGSTTIISGDKHDVDKIFTHPKYTTNYDYDAAIIVVKQPFKYSSTTQKIAIGRQEPKDGSVTYSGWGLLRDTDNDPPKHLQKVTVPVVPRNKCNDEYQAEYNGITDREWCAGLTGRGPCYGDSGGGIIQNGIVVGIVSWGGHGCGAEGYPAVNTNLGNSEIQQFINEHV